MDPPLIIAHRGSSAAAPENTRAAFLLALSDGADGIELDVRLASDGIPVVFHDESLKRITGNDIPVRSMTSAELGRISVGAWFNRQDPELADPVFDKEKIPTLDEVFKLLIGFAGVLFVELKCGKDDARYLVTAVCESVLRNQPDYRVILKSFFLDAIPRLRSECGNAETAALFKPRFGYLPRRPSAMIRAALDRGADWISVHHSLFSRRLMREARVGGLSTAIWTVDDPDWISTRRNVGIQAIITNRPSLLIKRRDELYSRQTFE